MAMYTFFKLLLNTKRYLTNKEQQIISFVRKCMFFDNQNSKKKGLFVAKAAHMGSLFGGGGRDIGVKGPELGSKSELWASRPMLWKTMSTSL